MKYKFHEEPPEADTETRSQKDFVQEINYIAKNMGVSPSRVFIDGEHPVGEYVIFVDGKYCGYLDDLFYSCFNKIGDYVWEDFWGFDN